MAMTAPGRILIIDDNPPILQLLRNLLTNQGYEAVAHSNPAEAMQVAARESFDAVLTDLVMEPVCGLQIIGGLRQMRDGSWDGGWIYDPEQGESFDVELRLRAPDLLQVKGYKGLKFLSETFQWRRAPTELQLACPAAAPNPA